MNLTGSGKIQFLYRSPKNLETLLARFHSIPSFNRRCRSSFYRTGTTWLSHPWEWLGPYHAAYVCPPYARSRIKLNFFFFFR